MDKRAVSGIGIIILIILGLWISNNLTSQESLKVESFHGIEIEEIICFDTISGKIAWRCGLGQLGGKHFSKNEGVIGLGHFSNPKFKAAMVFKYYKEKNLLTSKVARNLKCICSKRGLKGEILSVLNDDGPL